MRTALNRVLLTAAVATVVSLSSTYTPTVQAGAIEDGRKVAYDRKKGNCLACHLIQGATLPGNIGPPLIAMKARFPDRAALRAQIWDPTVKNPNSMMPPFGKYGVLSEKDIDLVVDFIYSL